MPVSETGAARQGQHRLAVAALRLAGQEVHAGRADEARHEPVLRVVVEIERRAELHDPARVEHDDAVGQRHRLDLVVGDVDHRGVERVVELRDLDPHLHAECCIEV